MHHHLLLLLGCLAMGVLLRRSGRVAEGGHAVLNTLIVHIALPALTLRHLHGFSFGREALAPVLMPWLLFAIGAAVFWGLGRWLGLPRATVGALTLVGGFGNTSFVGLPMIEALHGEGGLALGLVIDQLGSYLALSTVGVLAATLYAAQGPLCWRAISRKVLGFPPFIALVAALLLTPVHFPPALELTLDRLGGLLAPLALLSVGLQLRFEAIRQQARLLCLGLGYKLVAAPALVVALLLLVDAEHAMAAQVSVIEAAMPPMIGAGIVAAQARLDAPLVSTMIGIGIPLGLATACGWHWIFGVLAA
jgi:malate permease and related proteins